MSGQLDLTLDPLDEVVYRNRADVQIREHKWARTSHFNESELQGKAHLSPTLPLHLFHFAYLIPAILIMYYKLLRENGKDAQSISRFQLSNVFHVVFGMPDSFLMSRIFHALIGSASSLVSVNAWVKMMNIFLKGTLNEKIKFCYDVYDPTRQGIKREHMMNLLRKAVYKHEEEDIEEAVKDLVELILNKMDLDKDGKISLEDFKVSVLANPEMLECMGQCLPDRAHVYALLSTFSERKKKF